MHEQITKLQPKGHVLAYMHQVALVSMSRSIRALTETHKHALFKPYPLAEGCRVNLPEDESNTNKF